MSSFPVAWAQTTPLVPISNQALLIASPQVSNGGETTLNSISIGVTFQVPVVIYRVVYENSIVATTASSSFTTGALKEGVNKYSFYGLNPIGVSIIQKDFNVIKAEAVVQTTRFYNQNLAIGATLSVEDTVASVTFRELGTFPIVKGTRVQRSGKRCFEFERIDNSPESIYAGIGVWNSIPNKYGAGIIAVVYYAVENRVYLIANGVESILASTYFSNSAGLNIAGARLGVLVDVDTGGIRLVFNNQVGSLLVVSEIVNKAITPITILASSSGNTSSLKLRTAQALMSRTYEVGYIPFDTACELP